MRKILSLSSAIAIAALSMAPLGFAQEAESETADAAEASETPAQPTTRAQTPQEITAAIHGSWQVRCVTTEPKQCFLYQLIIDEKNVPLMEITLFSAKDETGEDVQMVANVVTPLGVILGRGLIMQVDNNDPVQRPFSWCAPQGCYSRFPVNGTELKQIKGGSKIASSIFMIQNPQQDIEIDLPLDGFGAAYDELIEMEKEASE